LIQNTAILLFIQEEAIEASEKIISKSYYTNKEIFKNLNSKAKDLAYSVGIPVFLSNELIPNNKSFAQNISESFQKVFDKGFEKVICIGNDCPALTKKAFRSAINKLQKNDAVFGADSRGGAYLIGLTKQSFEIEKFKNLKWQTSYLINSFLVAFTTAKWCNSEKLTDIHSFIDLLKYKTPRNLFLEISSLYKITNSFFDFINSFHKNTYLSIPLPLRAPPY
jgi:uncharacterized protein